MPQMRQGFAESPKRGTNNCIPCGWMGGASSGNVCLMEDSSNRPRVVIVGAGFGGVTVARHLAKEEVDVLILDRHNFHLFTPLLYQVSSALLDPSEIAQPVRSVLRGQRNVHFRMATVERVDLSNRVLLTNRGPIAYDFLVLAAGSANHYFGNRQLATKTHSLKELDAALELRNAVLSRFEEAHWERDAERRRALLTFAVIGGGPTGVEYAGALSELVRLVIQRDCRDTDLGEVRIVLLEGSSRLLAAFNPETATEADRTLRRKGIEMWYGALVKDVTGDEITLGDDRRLRAGTVVWTAGVRASGLGDGLGVQGRSGAVKVEPSLQLPGHPEVFVVGDLAALEQEGRQLPMLAPVAIQEGKQAARNISALMRGRSAKPFRYRDKGILATIGRNAAVAEFGPLHLQGFLGWVTWLLVHLLLIVSLRNRLIVLVNWAWDYFLFDRPVRLILRAGAEPTQNRNVGQSWLGDSGTPATATRART